MVYWLPSHLKDISDYGILWDKLIFTRFFTLLSILAINKKIRLRALLHNNFPYITDLIAKVKNATGDTFLPREVSQVFLSMMSLMDDFQALSYERAVKRTKPHVNYKPCEAECYPNNPEHITGLTQGGTKRKIKSAESRIIAKQQLPGDWHICLVIMVLWKASLHFSAVKVLFWLLVQPCKDCRLGWRQREDSLFMTTFAQLINPASESFLTESEIGRFLWIELTGRTTLLATWDTIWTSILN